MRPRVPRTLSSTLYSKGRIVLTARVIIRRDTGLRTARANRQT
jgi:hypothetical protein